MTTTQRPRILFVTTVAATARHFLAPYAIHLRSRGLTVDVAANGADRDAALHHAFDRVYELALSRSMRDVFGHVRGARRIRRILSAGYEIVHVHTPIAAFVTRAVIRTLPPSGRPKVVYTAHGFHFHRHGHRATNALFLLIERVGGRWTDRLVVINDDDHEAALRHRIVPPRNLVRMPGIGLDTSLYVRSRVDPVELARIRTDLGILAGAPIFTVVGELNRNKRPTDAVRALARMNHRDAHLVFVGDGRDRGHLCDVAARIGVRDRVHTVGFVTDVQPFVAIATALVMTSRREGLARSIMEALCLEVPVLATDARGNRELVDADGIIVPIGDVNSLARGMDWLIEHPEEMRAMGQHGRARMVGTYDVRTLTLRHERLYAELLGLSLQPPGASLNCRPASRPACDNGQ